jgi:hypothetical protein
MADYKQKQNQGALFLTNNKNDKAPIKSGKFVDDYGVIKTISLWNKVSKNGLEYDFFIISDFVKFDKPNEIKENLSTEIIEVNDLPF